jgi:hypothetical protein
MPDIDNMIRFAQWNMMSVGMKGSSMFFHSDGKGMSSMSAQITGRKRWMLCEVSMHSLQVQHLTHVFIITDCCPILSTLGF